MSKWDLEFLFGVFSFTMQFC